MRRAPWELRWINSICNIPHDKPRARYMCILTAYMDESGVHDRDWCVVAGFLGTDDQWKDCMGQWKAGLKKAGHAHGLHMRKLRWSKPDRVRKYLEILGPIPASCGLKRIWGGLRFQDYEDLLPEEIRRSQEISPYMLSCLTCFRRTRANVPANQRVVFTFARQDKYSRLRALPDWFLYHATAGKFNIHYLSEPTMLSEPADYLAFEIRETQIDINSIKSRLGASILGDGKGYGDLVPKDELRKYVTNTLKWLRSVNEK